MNTKAKGSNAERELLRKLWGLGFSVARVAGSGCSTLPAPDLIAIKGDKKIVFECKNWKGGYLSLSISQMDELLEWAERAKAEAYIGWKVANEGWYFLKPGVFTKTDNNYVITKRKANNSKMDLTVIAGLQTQLSV